MKIIFTLGEILHNGDWQEYCKATGLNEWAINEGLVLNSDEVTLTMEQIYQFKLVGYAIGIIKCP